MPVIVDMPIARQQERISNVQDGNLTKLSLGGPYNNRKKNIKTLPQ